MDFISGDFDKEIGFWIKNAPYIWVSDHTKEQCKRIYIIPKDYEYKLAAFDTENNITDVSSIDNNLLLRTYCMLPLGNKGCNMVRNCFLVRTDVFDAGHDITPLGCVATQGCLHNIRVEGQPMVVSEPYNLYPNIMVVDPETNYSKQISTYIIQEPEKQEKYIPKNVRNINPPIVRRLVPDYLPSKVVYNADSYRIAQKITKDSRRNISVKDMLISFYNTHSSDTEEVWSTNKNANAKYYEWFTKYTREFQNPTYVDIGCGSGKDALVISKEINAKSTTCVDVKDSRVSSAKDLEFLLIKEDAPINMENNTIDVVTLFHTIHHMKDAESRLRDIYRILAPKGLLIIKDHNVDSELVADNVTFEHFVYSIGEGEATVNDENTYKNIMPMYYYSAHNVDAYLKNIGFDRLYLNTYNNPTHTYNAVYKKR